MLHVTPLHNIYMSDNLYGTPHDIVPCVLSISIKIFNYQKIEKSSGMKVRQTILFREGITPENAKKISKTIKLMKLKIQSQIQNEQIRISGKKIDDLQIVINKVKKMNLDFPIQFVNMKK